MEKSTVIDAKPLFAMDEESQWIAQAKQGDKRAFRQLYQSYHRRIYALCWRMMADKDSAEDVCQEVFVQLWQKINNFRGDSKFSTWLHSVATNIVLMHLRKQKKWWQKVLSIESESNIEASIEGRVELIDLPELDQLDKYIMQLPERARVVFVLFAVEGYRHEEIAKTLSIAVGSSKAQYHRAKGLLKGWITP